MIHLSACHDTNKARLKLNNHLYSLLCRLAVSSAAGGKRVTCDTLLKLKDLSCLVHMQILLSRWSGAADTVTPLMVIQLDVNESHVLRSTPPPEMAGIKL